MADALLRTDQAFQAPGQVLARADGNPRWHDASPQFAACEQGWRSLAALVLAG